VGRALTLPLSYNGKQNEMGKDMREDRTIDITAIMVRANQFPARLQQLGFRVMQKGDRQGRDLVQYVLPPLVIIPAGSFLMGSDPEKDEEVEYDEIPQHSVYQKIYEIGIYPLTVAEYQRFVWAMGNQEPPHLGEVTWQKQLEQMDHPIVGITWENMQRYVRWLAQATGEKWRLPNWLYLCWGSSFPYFRGRRCIILNKIK
jgi:formylglycine-generating enzyme required for sulfatase activity